MFASKEGRMTQRERDVEINISAIPVAGVGGLGLVAIAVLVAVVMPAAGWLMVTGVTGGCLLGAVLVLVRRLADGREPGGRAPSVLFVESPAERRIIVPEGDTYKRVRPAYSTR
jgi:hypothetical protein